MQHHYANACTFQQVSSLMQTCTKVGDSDTDYADGIESLRRRNVLPLRRMLDAQDTTAGFGGQAD